jgi:hypothetical protein
MEARRRQLSTMMTNYLLIDYENVQPKSLEVLNGHPFRVIVFVGANQARVPVEFACSLQALGNAAQYVQSSDSGRNAVDFRIAFALGQLSSSEPDACFHIISKDNLQSRGNARPRKLKTLSSTINALFQKALQPIELRELIEALQQEGHITLDGEAVTYHLLPA